MRAVSQQSLLDAPRLISLVRGQREILAFVSESVTAPEADGYFEVKPVPLDRVKRSLYAAKDRLQESWRYLAGVKSADADTLYHVLIVLIETVPAFSRDNSVPLLPPEWADEPVPVRPTHAHPRAYKGTKSKPPKGRSLPSTDIRPHLCEPGSIQAILAPMWRFLTEVRTRLGRTGYSSDRLAALEHELTQAPATKHFNKRFWTLPLRFVQYIWPLVRQRPSREVSQHLALFATLGLENDDRLLWAISHLIAVSGSERAYRWGTVAAVLPPPRRHAFLVRLLETGACASLPDSAAAKHVEYMSALATNEQFPQWTERLLVALHEGVSVEYLLAGFRLAAAFAKDYRFEAVGSCFDFPERTVEEIGFELADGSSGGWLPMALWCACGKFPGLGQVVRASAWRELDREAASGYAQLLLSIHYQYLPELALQRKWEAIRRHIPEIEAVLLSTPETHQVKAVGYFSDWLWSWDEPAIIKNRMPKACEMVRRLARPPFETGHAADGALGWVLGMESPLALPDASYAVIERACRRGNDANLITRGISALIQDLDAFTDEALRAAPKKVMRTAKILGGTLRPPARAEIARRCREHPLFRFDPLAVPVKEACSRIRAYCGDGCSNPIPARLSAWWRGEISLSPGRLERYHRVLSERLLLTRLDLIEQLAMERLREGLPSEGVAPTDRHALLMLGSIEENRRGLRKFLSAYWSGDREYLSTHPATLAWYRKHKAVPRELWEHGIGFPSGQGLTIQVEHDPFEILKLGTYVGTCLGVGGICCDSAAAALLDANKKVLYARDQRGRVVARQLLAIADDDRLVCFSVYPLSCPSAIKSAFRDYDYAFARAMDLPLYQPSESDESGYRISSVLSVYWWDDCSWDFKTGE